MTAGESGGYLLDGRFELLERLGGGGMGLVWRARDMLLHREVALKEVRSPDPGVYGSDPAAAHVVRERVLREAQALARLHHPNVVTIYHIVDSPELAHPWLVMELVTGGSLEGRLDQGTLTVPEAVKIGRGVLSALRAAHEAGIQHRDVKPGNVLLRPDGSPVLTDFGIAALQESPGLTATGMLIGSPEYMAPERIHGREGDPASDLWSLGLLLYVGLEGYNPLRRDTTIATIAAVAEGIVSEPTRSGPLTPVLGALLVKDPARRPGADQLDWMLAEVERSVAASGLASSMASGAPASSTASTPSAWPTGDQRQPTWPQTAQFEASGGTAPNRLPDSGTYPVATPYGSRTEQTKAKQPVARYVASGMAAVVMSGGMVWMIHKAATTSAAGNQRAPKASLPVIFQPPVSGSDGTSPSAPPPTGPLPTGLPPATADPKMGLLTPNGMREMLLKVKRLSGGTRIVSMNVYPDHASLEVVKASDPAVYDDYSFRNGVAKFEGKGSALDGKNTIDPASINWDIIPGLLKEGDLTLNVPNPTYRYISLDSDLITQVPEFRLYVGDDYRSGYLATDLKGNVTRRLPQK